MEADGTKVYFDSDHLDWLEPHCGGWQFGEQGLLASIANVIDGVGRATEIGAGDGEELPLTIEPFYRSGVPCVLYESDQHRRINLRKLFPNAKVRGEYRGECSDTPTKNELLVIDIDGCDSHVMEEELTRNATNIAVLMVEHFDICHESQTDDTQRVPAWLLGRPLADGFNIQDTSSSIKAIAKAFGFKRIGISRVNSIFVRSDLYPLLLKPVPIAISLAGV